MLGTFLELAIASEDVAESLAFYESLGFVQASVGEAWPHPYAVVTDGRLHLGLHAAGLDGPLLTFVVPELRSRLGELEALGIEIEDCRLDDASLNYATFRDGAGHAVRLVEARTFSSPALDPTHESRLGYFEAYAVATPRPAEAGRFWEALGFVAFADEPGDDPARVVASSRDLNLAFHDADLAVPTLCFSCPDVPQRVEQLRDQGFAFARRLPRGWSHPDSALLLAPDGVQVLLVASTP